MKLASDFNMKKQFFRVKQLADQTFLRADKSEVLNTEELHVADQKIEYLRGALSAITKRIPHSGQNNDNDKRVKKCLEHHLAATFLEQCPRKVDQFEGQELPSELFTPIIQTCGLLENDLAKEYGDYEKQVDELVSAPIQGLLDSEIHNILKQKRSLSKYILDKDSASNRYNATKKEALKDDLEEADYKVEQSRDVLAFEMFSFLAKENDLAGYMLQILKCQRAYHECALNRLKDVIPHLEQQIGDSPIKRVYGISLKEHLRVTGRHLALPLEICVTLILRHGLSEEGLFRIAGSSSRVKRFKSSIDSGCFSKKPIPEYDVHVLTSALKLYLRELPEPILTSGLYNDWVTSMQKPESERLEVVRELLARLPKANHQNLAFLIQFLAELSRHAENKMSSSNIAIVIAPNLLWDSNESAGINMGDCAALNMLTELFIKEVQNLFPDDTSKLMNFPWQDEGGFLKINTSASFENLNVAESPKPCSRKKKPTAPGPPPNSHQSKTDQDLYQNDRNMMSMSYPSGSSTLNRPQKPKEAVMKATVGTNTDNTKKAISHDDATHKYEASNQKPLVTLDNTKTVSHQVITETMKQPVQISKAKPVQPVIAQNACDNNKSFKTTAMHPISVAENGGNVVIQKPVAAPRSIDGVTRTSSIKIELKQDGVQVQVRRPEPIAAKPEVPARPTSLSKRPSVDHDLTLQRTSVFDLANKQQPSYVNVQNRNEKFQPGHDHNIIEKEKFLGHHQPQLGDINSNTKSKIGLPPKAVRSPEKSEATKSNENLGEIGDARMTQNGNQKPSHVRTRSDGNLVDLSDSLIQPPPSPRSLNKPTQPPPPPPVKKEADSTDL